MFGEEMLQVSTERLHENFKTIVPELYEAACLNTSVEQFENEIVRCLKSRQYYGRQERVVRSIMRMIEYNGSRIDDKISGNTLKLSTITLLWRFLREDYHDMGISSDMLLDIYNLLLSIKTDDSEYSQNDLKADMKRWSAATDKDVAKIIQKNRQKIINAMAKDYKDFFKGDKRYGYLHSKTLSERKEIIASLWKSDWRFHIDVAFRDSGDIKKLLSESMYRKMESVISVLERKSRFMLTPHYFSLFNSSLNGYNDSALCEVLCSIDNLKEDILLKTDEQIKSCLDELVGHSKNRILTIKTDLIVMLPQRFNNSLLDILNSIKTNSKEVDYFYIETTFNSPLELTKEVLQVISNLGDIGWRVSSINYMSSSISRRGHLSSLRSRLNREGVLIKNTVTDQHALKNNLFAPYSRHEQESNEERVFGEVDPELRHILFDKLQQSNNPKLSLRYYTSSSSVPFIATDTYVHNISEEASIKNRLLVGITQDGHRVYKYETNVDMCCGYYCEPLSLSNYLKNISNMGEDVSRYSSIWSYV